MNNAAARVAFENANVKAFLRMLRVGEGTTDEDGYRRHFGGELTSDLSKHPRRAITKMVDGAPLTSTACGAYQFLSRTWDDCQVALSLPDFGVESQDLAAVFLIGRAGALADVISGNLGAAIARCAGTWASLPGSTYGQPTVKMERCRAEYEKWGGTYAPQATPQVPAVSRPDQEPYVAPAPKERKVVAPLIVGAAIDAIFAVAPKLLDLFKGSSENAKRNVEAAKVLIEMGKTATQAVNEQDLIEKLETNPEARVTLKKAVEDNYFKLSEVGEKSVAVARDFATSYSQLKDVRTVAGKFTFIELFSLLLVLFGFGGVGMLIYWNRLAQSTVDNIAMLAVVGTIIAVREFWLGSSAGSRQKDPTPDKAI